MLTPIKNTNEKLVFYVGEIEEDFIFNMVMKNEYENYGSIELKEMTDSSSLAILSTDGGVGSGNKVTLTLTPDNGVIGFVIQNNTNKNYTIDGEYKVDGSERPMLKLNKRGTEYYYCNGTGNTFNDDFNSNTLLSHEGVQSDTTIIYYVTYAGDKTASVDITLSFGEEFYR